MADRDPLHTYRQKRRAGTPEPQGGDPRPGEAPRFVIQKHDARRLHYDLRLEVEGVLKSWAVPKGPSDDPAEKRLAVPTEDHPLDYRTFEGVIPEGHYGAGAVLVWDQGTYRNIAQDGKGAVVPMERSVEQGRVRVWLEGEKLRGGWALTRTGRKRWILVKMRDAHAERLGDPVASRPESVVSGRVLAEVDEPGAPDD